MSRRGSPALGALDQASVARERPERRALLLRRSTIAPLVLAVTTATALAGAVLALLPAAVRRRPVGRRELRRAGPRAVPDPETTGEPGAP